MAPLEKYYCFKGVERMKKRKRFLALLLSLLMVFSVTAFAAPEEENRFFDISGHWAESMILELVSDGIINGYEDQTFRPEENINLDEFIKLAVTSLGHSLEIGQEYWASTFIDKAIELGMIAADEFDAYDRPITRMEMAKILALSLKGESESDLSSYESQIVDFGEIPEQYRTYVLRTYAEGLMTGNDDGTFRPNSNATRAEAVTVITRLIEHNGGISVGAAQLYVATDGDDSADGSENNPFQTIGRAKEAVRQMKANGTYPEEGVTIYLREGTYYIYDGYVFTKEDSGTEEGKVTYTTYPGESVTLSGNVPIEKSWFTAADEQAKSQILDQEAAQKVLAVNLKEHGITDYGVLNTRGYHYFNKGQYMAGELIVNGEKQTLARYPNEGTIVIKNDSLDPANLSFRYTQDSRPSSWVNAKDPWICGTISTNYENNYMPIESIDPTTQTIKLREGKVKTYYTNGWFFGENLLEEIDQVGEYYLDRETGILYYLPPDDFMTGDYTIGLSTLKEPMFRFDGASNIAVKNFTMEGGRGYAALGTTEGYQIMTYAEFVEEWDIKTNDNNVEKNVNTQLADPALYPEAQVFPGHPWDGFLDDGEGVTGIEFKNCNIRNFGQGGLFFRGTKIKLENNNLYNIGGTGIFMTGGDLETLESSENTIINNNIHDTGYQHKAYHAAIALHGVGMRIEHNELYNTPHCALNYHGNDNIIANNKIHDVVRECLDMDAIYTRNEYMPQWRGNVIRDNYFYNIGIFPVGEYTKQLNICAIRTDNYGHGMQIYNNIFANIGTENANSVIGVTAQGNRNTITGNLFLDCSTTYRGWNTYNPDKDWTQAANGQKAETLLPLVKKYADNPIFAEKYPELLTFEQEYFEAVPTNIFDENVVVNIKFPLSQTNGTPNPSSTRGAPELILGDNNLVTEHDVGFVDYANGNYELKPDSEVFTQIPNFKNFKMEDFGVTGNVGPVQE